MLFRKRIPARDRPVAPVVAQEGREAPFTPGSGRTVVGSQTRIRGTLSGEGSVVIRGEVAGGIAIGGGLTVTPTGRVDADVEAESVAVAGEAKGTLRAASRVILTPTGSFDGEMATPILEVRPGSVLRGRTRVAGVPSRGHSSISH